MIQLHCDVSLGNLFQLESVLGKKSTGMHEFDTVARQRSKLVDDQNVIVMQQGIYEQAHRENESGH